MLICVHFYCFIIAPQQCLSVLQLQTKNIFTEPYYYIFNSEKK